MLKNIYLSISILVWSIYFILKFKGYLKYLKKWGNYHFKPIRIENKKEIYNKSDCSNVDSEKCFQTGKTISKFLKEKFYVILLRVLVIYKPELHSLVLLDNVNFVVDQLIRWYSYGFSKTILIFLSFHLVSLILDIYFIFLKDDSDIEF